MLVAHISDLHLGLSSPGDPHGAERLSSFRQAMLRLAASDPDVFVIAGDTFHTPQIDRAIVEEAARILLAAQNHQGDRIPIVVIPGNHDPAEEKKLWDFFQKSLDDAVSVALEPTVIGLHEGKLLIEAYPCPERYSPTAPWEKRLTLPEDVHGAIRVVVAHGTLQGGPVPEGEADAYPFSQAELESLGAHYVALGHFHSVYPAWGSGAQIDRSFCYCGTHEPDEFGSDAGYAILADISRGKPTRLQRVRIGRRHWRVLEVASPADLAAVDNLRSEIAAHEYPGQFVIRLKADGRTRWPADKVARFTQLENALRTLGAHVERRGTLLARLDILSLELSGLPSGAVKEALLELQAGLGEAGEQERETMAAAIELGWEQLQEALPS
jgi:DNA repair exonuclease SbcCD nuclease subunit